MIWSGSRINDVNSLPSGSDWLLGFNEPNLASQSNMSPQECASLWPKLEATGRKLVSPAMAMSGTAVNWMQTFLDSCHHARQGEGERVVHRLVLHIAHLVHHHGC